MTSQSSAENMTIDAWGKVSKKNDVHFRSPFPLDDSPHLIPEGNSPGWFDIRIVSTTEICRAPEQRTAILGNLGDLRV